MHWFEARQKSVLRGLLVWNYIIVCLCKNAFQQTHQISDWSILNWISFCLLTFNLIDWTMFYISCIYGLLNWKRSILRYKYIFCITIHTFKCGVKLARTYHELTSTYFTLMHQWRWISLPVGSIALHHFTMYIKIKFFLRFTHVDCSL